jgi:hypothetical protein
MRRGNEQGSEKKKRKKIFPKKERKEKKQNTKGRILATRKLKWDKK